MCARLRDEQPREGGYRCRAERNDRRQPEPARRGHTCSP